MRDASAIVVVAIAAVLITRAMLGHRYKRRRKFQLTIEWDDGKNGDDESGVSPPDSPTKEE